MTNVRQIQEVDAMKQIKLNQFYNYLRCNEAENLIVARETIYDITDCDIFREKV